MSNTLSDSQLLALISLLDDRDESIVARCRARLVEEGDRARQALEDWIGRRDRAGGEKSFAPFVATLRRIRAVESDRALIEFAARGGADLDLETGALLIARTHDPDLDTSSVSYRLDRLAEGVDDLLLVRSDERVAAALRSVLAEGHGLSGNQADYHDPQNSFVDRVLERKLGIPISLSVVYLLVCRRLELEVEGIGMPGHFLLSIGRTGDSFLDPFHRARSLTRAECLAYLERAGYGRDESLLAPTPSRFIVARMLVNLLNVYRRRKDIDSAERYRRMFECVRGQPIE